MKNTIGKLDVQDMLQYAAAFDRGNFQLDPYEIHQLLDALVDCAKLSLLRGAELRLGTVSLICDMTGRITVRLKNRNYEREYVVRKSA